MKFLLALLAVPCFAATLTVCSSGCAYSTIQAAIDASANNDIIEIRPGIYVSVPISPSSQIALRIAI